MILGYDIAFNLSFDLVINALTKAIEVIKLHPDQKHSILVADGGKENHNRMVDQFIGKLSGFTVTKIRALKDIRFSNSPVEAIHRTIKSRYLRNRRFDSIRALNAYMEWVVKDYNTIRPHYKHRPRTPHEVYFNQPLNFDIRQRVREAIQQRVKKNKCSSCVECSCKG